MEKLLDTDTLELSSVVANSAMNRERICVGKNSYARELSFDPVDFLNSRIETRGQASWLDLCCGRGRALIEAAERLAPFSSGSNLKLLGVDLVLKFPNDADAGNKIIRDLRRIGFDYHARKHLIVCKSRKDFTLNYRYFGADDTAGPNYTGQAAVNSHYERLDVICPL